MRLVCRNSILSLLFTVVLFSATSVVHAQSYLETFGQNRIQNRKFDWKYFDTKHFRVYHYDKAGRQLGRYVAEESENDIKIIEEKLGGQFPRRFDIILYNSYDEYRQSNAGLKEELQGLGNSKAGTLNLVGDKLVVYFTGEHADLRHQIRAGMSRVVMERMVFGENFKKMVKNALLLNLPPWVTDGYIAYLVDGWDATSNSEWKGLLDARPRAGFYELAEDYPELAGKAFWEFVSQQYGLNTTKNLLYSMQQKTSLNKAVKDKQNLGIKVTKAYDSCIHFYKEVYAKDGARQERPDSTRGLIALNVPKDNTEIRNIIVSPKGADICYVAWRNGQYKVYIQKTAGSQVSTVLLEGGQKDLTEQTDPNYPMVAWSAGGNKLAVLYKKGDETRMLMYNNQRNRKEDIKIPKNRFDRVLSMTFMEDDDKMVFSAIKKSQTDLYMFTIKGTKMVNITDDGWDDLNPQFISGGSRVGVLFLSNRPKPNLNVPQEVNELPTGPVNVFFYNTRTMRPELLQCSNVKNALVTQPIQYGLDNFAYLCDSNGVNNKYVVLFARNTQNKDSAYSVPITNYRSSIISQQYSAATDDVADVIQEGDKYMVYFHDVQLPGVNTTPKELVPTTLSVKKQLATAGISVVNGTVASSAQSGNNDKTRGVQQPTKPEIKGGTAFQTEFSDTAAPVRKSTGRAKANKAGGDNGAVADSFVLTEITDSAYLKMKPAPYKLSFKPDFFSIKMDNSLLFSQYQSIATNGGQYNNPSLGALTTVSLNELMEDHRITGGFQLPLNVATSTYFLQYQNFKRRLDWGVIALRTQSKSYKDVLYLDQRGNIALVKSQLIKSVTNLVQADLSYPLDRMRSIRFHTTLRQDKFVQKVTDTLSLVYDFPNPTSYTSMSKLEYVFDNTITPVINIMNGTRFKVYTEYIYGLDKGNKSCYNIGFDARFYQKIYKNFIWATRVAYAHSDGSSEVEYLMGGVDNWVGPRQSSNAGQPTPDNYGFQTLSTPLRGYDQYARTGNNFGLINTEFRLPVLTTFMKRPIQSAILKNLQVVAFMDAGTAWKGFIPNAESMTNSYKYPAYPDPGGLNNVLLTLTVPNSGGLALGYGAGLRTSLFGYFVRFDAAWNIDGSPKPSFYFSIGTDF